MSVYHHHELGKLADKIKNKSKTADKAAALTINKSATFAIRESIKEITSTVNLQESYVKKHLKTIARASSTNLRAIIAANERGTLLSRYPTVKSSNGIKVAVNKAGGYREIPKAVMVRTKSSGIMTVGMFNIDFVEALKSSMGRRTPAKSRKLQRMIRVARNKPYGRTPLHSRSINQLFTSARGDIQSELREFMIETFYEDFRRLSKK